MGRDRVLDAGPARAHARRRRGGVPFVALLLFLSATDAAANPILDRDVRAMDERPSRWLARRDSTDELDLVVQFSRYGVSRRLLSASTIDLLEREFDGFAQLFVRAQTPPNVAHPGLQRWFRERADASQAEAMKRSLREWLTLPLAEAPVMDGSRVTGPPNAVDAGILEARRKAAEALGDWRDESALPGLRALLATLPSGDPVVESAIRRVSRPARPEILGFDAMHRAVLGRAATELDSVVVTWRGREFWPVGVTHLDPAGRRRAWAALARATDADLSPRTTSASMERDGLQAVDVTFHLRDGDHARLALDSDHGCDYLESGRPGFRVRLRAPDLVRVLARERERIGIEPLLPHFIEESVSLFIDVGVVHVRGRYVFEGAPPDGTLRLRYPMARGIGLGPPVIESMWLRRDDVPSPVEVRFEPADHEARVALAVGSAHRYELIVDYDQPLTGRQARYLVTTAREWGRPLRRGRVEVVFARALGEPRLSPPAFEEVGEEAAVHRRFILDESPFEPEEDVVVSW